VCLGGEPVRIEDTPASRVTSGGYGHRTDRSIAYAYLPLDAKIGDRVEIGLGDTWISAEVAREPLYDPEHTRIRNPG
jgi:4-methylaminobutanoate oxidase (formaldehyde-forming)